MNEHTILKICQMLQRKKINLDLLAQSKAGKTMTRILKAKFEDEEIKETA